MYREPIGNLPQAWNVSFVVRSIVLLITGSSILLAGGFERDHPEWGPPPPVAPFGMSSLPSEKVAIPIIFPVLGESRWVDGYGENRGKFLHTGIDIRAAKMTPIVAPFAGTIGLKKESFWIYGDSGWSMLGTHLNDDNLGTHDHHGDRDLMFAPNVAPGQRVVAGQFIGYVGESGDATAPHLHFEIYAPGTGPTMGRIRNPFPSLKAARIITSPLPALPYTGAKPQKGEVRLEGVVRRCDEKDGTLTLLLTDVQTANGSISVVTSVQYRKVKVSASTLTHAGGWSLLHSLSPFQTVSVFVPDSQQPDPKLARNLRVEPR